MTVNDFDHSMLMLAVWRQAKESNADTMICLANLIMNLSKRDGLGVGAAILEHRRMHGITVDEEDYPDVRDPRFTKLLQRIDEVGSMYSDDITAGAVYYLDLVKPIPDKLAFLLNDPENHPRVAIAGTKHFFR